MSKLSKKQRAEVQAMIDKALSEHTTTRSLNRDITIKAVSADEVVRQMMDRQRTRALNYAAR